MSRPVFLLPRRYELSHLIRHRCGDLLPQLLVQPSLGHTSHSFRKSLHIFHDNRGRDPEISPHSHNLLVPLSRSGSVILGTHALYIHIIAAYRGLLNLAKLAVDRIIVNPRVFLN